MQGAEKTYQGFMETYDSAMAMAQSGFVRQRLESGLRDAEGRFRIATGTSTLHKEDPQKKGLTIAQLQAQVDAERKAKEDARRSTKKRKADSQGASTAGKKEDEEVKEPEWQSKWVAPGIVVKIVSKENKDLYKAKGTVLKTARDGDRGDVVATVALDDGTEHDVHSKDLETVIPAVGGRVKIVSGRYRGATGELTALEVELFQGRIRLEGGASDGKEVLLDYEAFSKLGRGKGGK